MQTFSGRRASQDPDELDQLIDLMLERKVRSYLEIGARHGDTFHQVMMRLPEGSVGVAVDLPGGAWGTVTSATHLREVATDLRRQGRHVTVHFGDSKELVRPIAKDAPFDAILIDGDHRYDGVRADWLNYGPMGKLVAFHDIAGDGVTSKDGKAYPVDVPRLWRELKLLDGWYAAEFVTPGAEMGIGALWRAE